MLLVLTAVLLWQTPDPVGEPESPERRSAR
jgi:hypothetical protein